MGIGRYIEIDTQRFSDSEKDPVQETADMKKPGHPGFFISAVPRTQFFSESEKRCVSISV